MQPFLHLDRRSGSKLLEPYLAAHGISIELGIWPADIEFLGIQSPADALMLNIVTVRNEQATVNLKGPIVVNRHTLIGKQCIPTNVAEYALQHPMSPMPVAA